MPESCCRVRPSGFADLADDWTESRYYFMLPWLPPACGSTVPLSPWSGRGGGTEPSFP